MTPLLAQIYSIPWAMRLEALADLIALVNREDVTAEMLASSFHFSEEAQKDAVIGGTNRYAVHQRLSTRVDGTNGLYRRGLTAILPVTGPIVRRGGASLSSGPVTSVEVLARDFTRAVEDDAFASILLDVDSPGGEASGIDEFARMIFQARSEKPIWAYVSDLGASAGYWIASAAEEVVIAPSAAVGSIGCVMAVRDPAKARDGIIEFVSSMSPNKRPDPHTKDGKAEIQSLVDALGTLFVDAVALHRGVTADTVMSDFGAGGIKVGQAAVDSGMADRLGSLEGTLRELAGLTKPQSKAKASTALPATEPIAADEERALPVEAVAESSPAATAQTVGTGVTVDLFSGLKALVDQYSGDQATLIATQNLGQTPVVATTSDTQAPPAPTPVIASSGDDELAALRRRATAAEAENMRLRMQAITDRAKAFARVEQDAGHAMAAESEHLINLYCLLAQDDELHGPVALGGGKTANRVTFLETFMAARPTRRDLTQEAIEASGVVVLGDRARPKADPNAEPSPDRMAELLAKSPAGRDVLATLGQARSN